MTRILIVEDDRDMQAMYGSMFKGEARKCEVQIVDSAERALREIDQAHFDLVISDIVMRTMCGECFIERMRKVSKDRTPILVVSVLSPDMLMKLKKMPDVHFLQKPITNEKLFKKISDILRTKGGAP